MRPELHFACRPHTCDPGIFFEVVLQIEYRLPPFFEPDDVIVDVGGHIGAFAYACLIRGVGKVITCEPELGNVELLRKNLARFGDRVEIIPAAVWPKDVQSPGLAPPINPYDTCQFSMVFREGGVYVPTVTLSEVLKRAGNRIRLLKLDCEGAKYAILDKSHLATVVEVCGESHQFTGQTAKRTIDDLRRMLDPLPEFICSQNGPCTHLWWAR